MGHKRIRQSKRKRRKERGGRRRGGARERERCHGFGKQAEMPICVPRTHPIYQVDIRQRPTKHIEVYQQSTAVRLNMPPPAVESPNARLAEEGGPDERTPQAKRPYARPNQLPVGYSPQRVRTRSAVADVASEGLATSLPKGKPIAK